jgi:hypothetical protein
VPYFIHTNYELALMLDGIKPLAVFSYTASASIIDDVMSRFAPFVALNRIDLTEERYPLIDRDGGERIMVDLFYTLPGEAWRIELYRDLLRLMRRGAWNDVCEQMESLLLGYTLTDVVWWSRHGWWSRPAAEPPSSTPETRLLIKGSLP